MIPTEWGTTYNSYLIKAEKPCLIDTVKADFADEFLQKVEQEIALDKIEYLVVNHTEPDHSGAVGALLEKAPHVKVYGTRPAIQFLREQVKRDFTAVVVSHNDTLDLGNKLSGLSVRRFCTGRIQCLLTWRRSNSSLPAMALAAITVTQMGECSPVKSILLPREILL